MTKRLIYSLLVLAGLGLAAGLMLWVGPECLILKYTGFYCAGCGSQHMVLALLRGDLVGAARENLFMLILLPTAGAYFIWEVTRYVQGKPGPWRGKKLLLPLGIVLVVAVIFTLARNIPGSWFAPAWAAN